MRAAAKKKECESIWEEGVGTDKKEMTSVGRVASLSMLLQNYLLAFRVGIGGVGRDDVGRSILEFHRCLSRDPV